MFSLQMQPAGGKSRLSYSLVLVAVVRITQPSSETLVPIPNIQLHYITKTPQCAISFLPSAVVEFQNPVCKREMTIDNGTMCMMLSIGTIEI